MLFALNTTDEGPHAEAPVGEILEGVIPTAKLGEKTASQLPNVTDAL